MIAAPAFAKAKNRAREQAMETIVGTGKYRYRVHEDWAHAPAGVDMKPAAVAVDPLDRVYCFNRNPDHPVVVFDRSAGPVLRRFLMLPVLNELPPAIGECRNFRGCRSPLCNEVSVARRGLQ